MAKLNCWEYKKCGRYLGGEKAKQCGTCVAAKETKTNGVNNGKNGGRCCWAVAGTLCGGSAQGSFATKLNNCFDCEFYWHVNSEEGKKAVPLKEILKLIHQ